ncbi:hypothetical protein OS493_006424 [Desmophyllum pertusum]|uniref:Uncharacterized protein n=1 Tax=Desmophyllum pertusum TaxID=174260 RepID=A0A9X0DB34_9CNID|nr:hypothetical protein OS493_006424 [Desmophyllum pertusum]
MMAMGKLLSSLLPCCVKTEESESNPKQRLVGGNRTQSSYDSSAAPHNILDPHTKQSYPDDSLEASSTSIYYTPSSSVTVASNMDRPVTPVVQESNAIPC